MLSLNLVPHTAEETNINDWTMGSTVNLEVDVLARYLERLLMGDKAADHVESPKAGGIDMAFLADNGYLRK